MEQKGIKPKHLAEKLGIHQCSVSYLLNNDLFKRPREVAEALGVNLKDIVE
jgi:hypothetical protein